MEISTQSVIDDLNEIYEGGKIHLNDYQTLRISGLSSRQIHVLHRRMMGETLKFIGSRMTKLVYVGWNPEMHRHDYAPGPIGLSGSCVRELEIKALRRLRNKSRRHLVFSGQMNERIYGERNPVFKEEIYDLQVVGPAGRFNSFTR